MIAAFSCFWKRSIPRNHEMDCGGFLPMNDFCVRNLSRIEPARIVGFNIQRQHFIDI